MAVTENKINAVETGIAVHRSADRGHGMAVDQQAAAEPVNALVEQLPECGVVGDVKAFDGRFGDRERQLAGINIFAAGNHLGDGAEPGTNPGRTGIDVVGQGAVKHFRIQFEGLAVGVDIGARKMRQQ